MVDAVASTAVPARASGLTINRIGLSDLRGALLQGWDDFCATPSQLVFLTLIYPIVGGLAARAAWGGDLMPMLWPLVSGFALLGPVAALGVYEISRRREQGLPTSVLDALRVRHSPALGAIMFLACILLGLFLAWLIAARLIWGATLGGSPAGSVGALVDLVFGTAAGWRLIGIGTVVGFGFALSALCLTVISFPLLLDRCGEPGEAIRTSLRAVAANPVPMATWGLLVAGLLVLGSIPAFVGLAVVVPVLGHATWHLYRRVVR